MNCNNCGTTIPTKRSDLGYKTCIDCSTTEAYGCVNIINHKTGNTVQVMSREQASAINKIGDRKRFGTILRGGSKSDSYNPKKVVYGGCSTSFVGSKELFDEVGEKAVNMLELRGLEAALGLIDKECKEYTISGNQAFRIRQIVQMLNMQNNLAENQVVR